MRSATSLITMAVLLMAMALDNTKAVCHSIFQRVGAKVATNKENTVTMTRVNTTCNKPRPNTCFRIDRNLGRLNSSPITNIKKTTPNSARCLTPLEFCANANALGPITTPTAKYPNMGGNLSRRQPTTPKTAASKYNSVNSKALMPAWYQAGVSPQADKIACMSDPSDHILQLARETLEIEANALRQVKDRLDARFVEAVHLMLTVQGRVVVTGMGKSGHIGRKIAATLASTGTPAMFVHPGEASHGDLGMIQSMDLVLAISNSGESDELVAILPVLKRQSIRLIALTGGLQSSLAQHADVVLDCSVDKEACPLNLAPTASTTAQLAMGDALAVALLDARGFQPEDFARSHPGGALGRRLLTHVSDLMRQGDGLPRVGPLASLSELMREMSRKGLGASAVVDEQGHVLGIFTDGDLRRLVEKGADLRQLKAQDVMHAQPHTLRAKALAVEAADMMERFRITSILVVDDAGLLCGALNTNDLLRAKVI